MQERFRFERKNGPLLRRLPIRPVLGMVRHLYRRAAALQVASAIDYDDLDRAGPLLGWSLLQLHAGRTR